MRDYLVIAAGDEAANARRFEIRDRLIASKRWRAVAERLGISILIETAASPGYRHLPGVAGGVIGDLYDAAQARQGVGADFRVQTLAGLSPRDAALALSRGAFGRYLAIFTDGPNVTVYRDPMGTIEAMTWRSQGLGFIGSRLPCDRALWPAGLAIDWSAVSKILRQKNLASHLSPLVGVTSVTSGVLTPLWREEPSERLWAPGWFAQGSDRRWRDPGALARVVDGATAAMALGRDRIICEISGGLDSAIVASALARCKAPIDYAINHSWAQTEADESAFARAVAHEVGARLEVVDRELLVLDAEKLSLAAGGPRPNYVGGDPDHDADLAARLAGDSPGALFTGRGGDAVFYQMPASELVLDLIGRSGGVRPIGALSRLASRRAMTVWRLLREAKAKRNASLAPPAPSPLFSAAVAQAAAEWHPWLSELSGVSPAKQTQLRAITNSLSAFGESQRHRAGDILDPLMAQPVVEVCLSIPAPLLAIGETDRPFARRAFADRLPAAILTRQGKGDLSVFFARSLAASLDFLRDYLVEGRLAAHGLLDREALLACLDADQLIWRDSSPDVFVILALESWVRRWEALISSSTEPTAAPATVR
ncbi:asparagine synthase-related protein [Caulobacter sp.]|uniref:asparagine synthase-related protein n=1 Tax=Caulobacter sp. TaxID=78 RepID=UPI0031CFFEBB